MLVAWLLYALVRAASQRYYFVEEYHYLTPFSSPCLSTSCVPGSRDFGTWFGEFPPFVPLGLLVLPFLLRFRLTCYYYRKAYYRSFWLSPPACAVAEPHGKYTGETRFPLILQNAHRYFFYAAIVDLADQHLRRDPGVPRQGRRVRHRARQRSSCWSTSSCSGPTPLSCHSCRHIVGGRLRALLQAPDALLAVDQVSQAQHQPHGTGLDHARRRWW